MKDIMPLDQRGLPAKLTELPALTLAEIESEFGTSDLEVARAEFNGGDFTGLQPDVAGRRAIMLFLLDQQAS